MFNRADPYFHGRRGKDFFFWEGEGGIFRLVTSLRKAARENIDQLSS